MTTAIDYQKWKVHKTAMKKKYKRTPRIQKGTKETRSVVYQEDRVNRMRINSEEEAEMLEIF